MRKLLLTLLLAVPAAAFAQNTYNEGTSFGARATVEADAKVAKGLHVTAHEEFRWYSAGNDLLRSYTGVGVEYKVLSFLKVGAEYELINRYKLESKDWTQRHRGNFFLTGTYKTTDWQFGLKETFRVTHRPGEMNTLQAPRNALALKSKVSVKYLGLGSVVPYAGFEVKTALNDARFYAEANPYATEDTPKKDLFKNEKFLGYDCSYVSRLRAQLGVTVKFDKHHALDFYLLGDHYKDREIDTNKEGSDSWKENGLVLKSIDWYTGNLISAGVGYKWSF